MELTDTIELIHGFLRWLVLLTLVWAIIIAWKGRISKQPFQLKDRVAVSAASILSHIQLIIGFALYYWSPVALAKRDSEDSQKFNAVFLYYSIALLIILVAIPWPFSPLAQRPYFRGF
jgi:hypothetical protein